MSFLKEGVCAMGDLDFLIPHVEGPLAGTYARFYARSLRTDMHVICAKGLAHK